MPSPNENHTCIKEPEIAQIHVRQDYETQRIDELKIQIDKMDKKLDKVLDGFNELKLQSNRDDNQLEIRLTQIETDMENQKQEAQRKTVWIGIGLTILTILINLYFQMVH